MNSRLPAYCQSGKYPHNLTSITARGTLFFLAAAFLALDCGATGSPAQTVGSQPGLLATYEDEQTTLLRVVPTPNFRLRASETIHPQITPNFSANWQGLLRIDRAGKYRLQANADIVLQGADGSEWQQLATGEHPLQIHYRRRAGEARLELRWESDFFSAEPVPSAALRHLETPPQLALQDSIERGRSQFTELGCGNCHAGGSWNQRSRRGPDLTNAGARLDAGWIEAWLRDPHAYRPAAVMPVCLHNQQERLDVTAFLTSLRSDQPAAVLAPPSAAQRATGERLFTEVGCSKCHQKENHLDYVGSKYTSLQHLTDYIADPHALDPQGRMPRLFDPREERHLARAVAGYLLEQKRHPTPYPAVAAGDAQRGARLFYTRGCASCHALNRPAEGESALQPPAFGVAHDFTLRHYWDFEGTQQVALQDRVTQQHQQVTGRLAFRDSGPGRGAAFDFDGNSFIEVEHFPRPDTMTLSVWIQTTKGGSIVTWGRPQGGLRGSREWRMNIGQDGTNSICYGEYNSDGGWRPVIVTPTAVNLIDGQWHHLAVVRQGPTIQHYVDGRPQGTPGETHVGGGNYTNRLLVGALGLQQNPSNRFQGTLDDLSIWEIALGEEQIAALAAGRSPLEIAEPSVQEIEPFQVDAGCLAHDLPPTVPNYQLGPDAREDLRRFLRTVHPQAASDYHASPLTTHDLRIQQFRCTACHQYHDKNIQQSMQVDEEGRILRVEHPPVLTGVGAKLSSAWLREVLLEGKRNRPWLKVRMPHFGPGIRDLPDLLTRSAGAPDETQTPAPARELASAGLAMVGERRGQVACIACHDYRGINRRKAGVVPAPDIALAAHTVRRDWFQRWMLNPSRIQPGTSMPQMFLDLPGEQRALHIDQLWSALFYQDQLALPAGLLAKRTEGTRILVGSEPVIFRMSTKTPAGQVDRAINVGLPGGFNFTWDATQCRLVYVWKGDFLDAGPAWNGRGGNPVNAGNEALASLAEGHKLHLASEAANGPRRFLGYRLEEGLPVFRYALGDAHVEHRVNVSAERILQKFIVEHAPHDLLYVGDSKHRTRSPTAKQDKQDVLRFPQADRLLFQIEIPLDATSRLESK